MTKCSVIIPIYNVELYLQRCVDSFLAQTFTDFELILVDDGSTDRCGKICDIYEKADSRIKVIHQENGGLSAARNTGLNNANGKFIYFADSDDYVSPTLLERCMEAINDFDLVTFNYQNIDEEGRTIGTPTKFYSGIIRWNNEEEKTQYLEKTFFHYSYLGWNACIRFFRKDIIERNHLQFADNKRIYAEDMYFSYCYEIHCNSIVCINDCLYFYTQRASSIMGGQERNNYLNLNRLNELSKAINKHLLSFEGLSLLKMRFPLTHMNIIKHAFDRIQKSEGKMNAFCKRDAILANVEDIEYFKMQSIGIIRNKQELKKLFGLIGSSRIIREWRYYLTGNKFFYQLDCINIFFCKIHEKLKRIFLAFKEKKVL